MGQDQAVQGADHVMIARFWQNAHLLLALASLFWAGHAVALRMSVGDISPLLLMELRWLGSCLILAVMFRRRLLAYWPAVIARWRFVLAMGGGGLAGFTVLLVFAAQHTTAMNLGILQGVIPALVMLFGLLFMATPVTPAQGVGFLLSLGGVMVLVSAGSLKSLLALAFNGGDLLMVAACFCYAGYTVSLSKRLDMPPMMMLFFFALAALAVCSLFTLVEYARGALVLPSAKGGMIVLYCAIFPSILSQTFFMRGVELAGANRAGLYVNLVPVFAAFLAVMLLGEIMQPYHMLALVAVVSGIYLAERGKPS
jgi:drug/metabolite transporter (DMT)-like permease